MNQAQGMIKLFLEMNTDMEREGFFKKFKNIVAAKLQLVCSNGEVHTVDFVDIMKLDWTSFEIDEEMKKSPDNAMSGDQIAI